MKNRIILASILVVATIFIFVLNYPSKEFYEYNVIAHGCGGIDGYIYTDSMEAIENSYLNGTRLFDIDLRFSSDNQIIIRHDWDYDLGQPEFDYIRNSDSWASKYKQGQRARDILPSKDKFIQTPIYGKYHAISFDDVYQWAKLHKNTYFVLDTKEDVIETYRWIIDNYGFDKSFLDQIVVSCYDVNDLKEIFNIYDFKNVMLRKYEVYYIDFDDFINNCIKYKVKAVSVSLDYYDNYEGIKKLHDLGIKIYWAIENDIENYKNNHIGDGVISDWITENDITELIK